MLLKWFKSFTENIKFRRIQCDWTDEELDYEELFRKIYPGAFLYGGVDKYFFYQVRQMKGIITSEPLGNTYLFPEQAWRVTYLKLEESMEDCRNSFIDILE